MNQHFRSFIIGSSYLVFYSFFKTVSQLNPEIVNYTYQDYTMIAPLYLGLVNLIGGIIFANDPFRFIKTGLFSGIFVALIATYLNSYNFTLEEWKFYYFRIILKHTFTFGAIIATIESYLK